MTNPTTYWEDNGGNAWTPLAAEATFLDDVASGSPRVAQHVLGGAATGVPIHVVVVGGDNGPPPLGMLQNVVLVVCGAHGNEPAAREAALIVLRDMAFDQAAGVSDALDATPLVFVPTLNPEGRDEGSRTNSRGLDVNRCHLSLQTPETMVVRHLVDVTVPLLIYDGHESSSATNNFEVKCVEHNAPVSLQQWQTDFVGNVAPGFLPDETVGPYPPNLNIGTLTSVYSGSGIPSVLGESLVSLSETGRVGMHTDFIKALYQHVVDDLVGFEELRATARAEVLEAVFDTGRVTNLAGSCVQLPDGWLIDGSWAWYLGERLGLEWWHVSDRLNRVFVPRQQGLGGLVAWLLDPGFVGEHSDTSVQVFTPGVPVWGSHTRGGALDDATGWMVGGSVGSVLFGGRLAVSG